MSISRMRNAQHKVYIPSSARENQYLMVKIPLSEQLLDKYKNLIDMNSKQPYQKFYQTLADTFFNINDSLDIESSQFIANDKFPRVRFSPEKLTSQTNQQVLFLYNPSYHTMQNSFFDGSYKAKRLTLVFLANGEDIRSQSAKFHQTVKLAASRFADKIGVVHADIRISDHQHLTYDLYAKSKGVDGTQVHKFRSISDRYLASKQPLPADTTALTYAIVDFPINRRIIKLVEIDDSADNRYNELYNLIADAFITSAKNHNLNNGAVIANGLVPIVRKSEEEKVTADGELQMLGYNPTHSGCGYTCKWSSNKLVDTVQLVFVASEQHKTSHGYGKFINQIESSLRSFAEQLGFVSNKEEMLVRLHQHIGFDLD